MTPFDFRVLESIVEDVPVMAFLKALRLYGWQAHETVNPETLAAFQIPGSQETVSLAMDESDPWYRRMYLEALDTFLRRADVPMYRLLASLTHGSADTWAVRARDAGADGTIALGALPGFAHHAADLFGGLARSNAVEVLGQAEITDEVIDRYERSLLVAPPSHGSFVITVVVPLGDPAAPDGELLEWREEPVQRLLHKQMLDSLDALSEMSHLKHPESSDNVIVAAKSHSISASAVESVVGLVDETRSSITISFQPATEFEFVSGLLRTVEFERIQAPSLRAIAARLQPRESITVRVSRPRARVTGRVKSIQFPDTPGDGGRVDLKGAVVDRESKGLIHESRQIKMYVDAAGLRKARSVGDGEYLTIAGRLNQESKPWTLEEHAGLETPSAPPLQQGLVSVSDGKRVAGIPRGKDDSGEDFGEEE